MLYSRANFYFELLHSANSSSFRVDVDEASFSLRVTAVFTDIFDMYPAEITQNENQLVRLKGSHFFVSPYHTETQKLVVKLPSSSIESFTKKAPFSMRGNSLHFGPYTNVEPFKVRAR